MGYCYESSTGRLCCDVCDHAGGVRKFRCPFGWCQAIALCPECRRKHPEYVSAETHRQAGCEKRHQEFAEHEDQRKALIEFGEFVRCSALTHRGKHPGPEDVKVIFHGANGQYQTYWMSEATYHAIPLGVNATPDDYRKHGNVIEAKSLDIYDDETGETVSPAIVATKQASFF